MVTKQYETSLFNNLAVSFGELTMRCATMTKQQIQWAMQHDWFHNANGDVVYVIEYMSDGSQSGPIAFNDYQELRAWAGY